MGARKKGIFAGLILAGLMIAVPGSALAIVYSSGNTAGGATCLDTLTTPSASGAKLTGTLNVDYQFAGPVTCLESSETKSGYFLAYTMRVVKGTSSYFFDGLSPYPICVSDCANTVQILNDFVNQVVAPFVYWKQPAPTAILKSVTNDVGSIVGSASGPGGSFYPWFMVDFEYAVK